ncbi:hypothetical protein NDU88_005757 [Pleurodeles waltl]|uniref:Uncharacterized protein n=1 Tax=Pleurodeles waltl TaxID=8319 RepID=A0AAV7QJY9_PLEWA|nr:hypothetical protein NDU88_005757 [Pleurodeles waltl]
MSVFQTSHRRYVSSPQRLDFAYLLTCPSASVLHSLLHCFSALVRRLLTQMPARGSKVVQAGAGAVARQERTRGSGGAGECKVVRASTRMAGGTVEPNANILNGDCVMEQEDGEIQKESSQAVNCDVYPTPARINMPTEEAVEAVFEEGRKSEPSNDSVTRDTLAEAQAQALTQALVHDLSSVNMGEKAQKDEQILENREGSSQAWKMSWSKAGSETTTAGEDEDEKSEWGKGSGQPESFKVATVKFPGDDTPEYYGASGGDKG